MHVVDIEAQEFDADGIFEDVARRAVLQTLAHCGADFAAEISVIFVGDGEMAGYNALYRQKAATTDVLSFPQYEAEIIPTAADEFICLGDIIVNIEAALRQAAEYGHSQPREVAFLAVHGALHLLGHSHDSKADEARMFAAQEEILRGLGLER